MLRQVFLEHGIEINTPDLNTGRPIAFDLFFEGRQFVDNGIPKYLVALENPHINRLNENRDYCRRFVKVFAWDSRLFDLPNVVQIMVPNRLSYEPFSGFAERDIFSCLINANKAFREPLESDLYLERVNTIRWYERHAPSKFELYGLGWAKPSPAFDFKGKFRRRIARIGTQLFGYKPFPSYRGELRDKGEILRRCKFSYCYENTRDLSNYITEKIFDSFLYGSVPVYWGADNVQEHIPPDSFIDRRNFRDTGAVHEFLLSVTADNYTTYQLNIAKFLTSNSARKFQSEQFVSTVVSHVTKDFLGRSQS